MLLAFDAHTQKKKPNWKGKHNILPIALLQIRTDKAETSDRRYLLYLFYALLGIAFYVNLKCP